MMEQLRAGACAPTDALCNDGLLTMQASAPRLREVEREVAEVLSCMHSLRACSALSPGFRGVVQRM